MYNLDQFTHKFVSAFNPIISLKVYLIKPVIYLHIFGSKKVINLNRFGCTSMNNEPHQ
jgi:hypothetical protein